MESWAAVPEKLLLVNSFRKDRPMLSSSTPIAFVPAKDAARARAFYEGLLGLQFLSDDQFAMVFQANQITVRIVRMGDFTPAPYTILGWEVSGIDEMVAQLTARGVAFQKYPWLEQDAAGIWTAPDSTRVAWFADPDGNILSLSEHRKA